MFFPPVHDGITLCQLADIIGLQDLALPYLCRARDDQILRLARRGGVIGINQVRFLARQPGSAGTLEDLCDHIQRIERIAGPGHTGLGLDFARGYMEALPKPKDFWQSWNPLEEDILDGYDALPQVTAMLLERGVVGSEVAGILGGNFLQFLRKALREK